MPSYLITGASRGLGYTWITHLASNPSNTVIGIVRNKPATEARLAKDNITNIHLLSADVTDLAALKAAAAETAKITGGGLDVLVHNAAFISTTSKFRTVAEIPAEEFGEDLMESFAANVVGSSHVLSTFLPLVREGSVKKMIVTSSGMADEELVAKYRVAVGGSYAISKHAVNMLVAKFHAAVAEEGILVLAMCPGYVDTQEDQVMSEEDVKGNEALGKKFAEFAPPSFKGPISPLESVECQLKVIERATVDEFGGKFVSHFGNKQWL